MKGFDRFAQGRPDPQAEPTKVVARCACGCGQEIVEGYDHYQFDGDWFYDDGCVMRYIGAERRVAG